MIALQRIAPDLAAPLWRVRTLRELPLKVRGQIADVLGCETAARGLNEDEEPNAYGVELGELVRRARAVGLVRAGADLIAWRVPVGERRPAATHNRGALDPDERVEAHSMST